MKRRLAPLGTAEAKRPRSALRPAVANLDLDTTCMTPEAEWFHAANNRDKIDKFAQAFVRRVRSRPLACVDAFGASGQVKAAFERHGEQAVNYDIKARGKVNDITCSLGWFTLLLQGLRLRPGALVKGAPPCSWFIFLSSSVHKRSEGAEEGDTQNCKVRLANLIVQNFLVFLDTLTKHERQIYFVIEQPSSSFMMKMKMSRQFLHDNGAFSIFTYMGAFQHRLLKPSFLYGNLPTLPLMARSKPVCFKKNEDLDSYYTQSAQGRVTGGKLLAGAAEYTEEYCEALYYAWRRTAAFSLR